MDEWAEAIPETRDEILALPEMQGWDYKIYDCLIRVIRAQDKTKGGELLRRFLEGMEFYSARQTYVTQKILDLIDPFRCPKERLMQLGAKIGLPEEIMAAAVPETPGRATDDDYTRLRSLVTVSPWLMDYRGTPFALSRWIQAVTGRKATIIYPHLDRASIGQSAIGQDFTLYESAPTMIVMVPWIDDVTSMELVKGLVIWNKPIGYRAKIVHSYLFDEFETLDETVWEVIRGDVQVVESSGSDPQFEEVT